MDNGVEFSDENYYSIRVEYSEIVIWKLIEYRISILFLDNMDIGVEFWDENYSTRVEYSEIMFLNTYWVLMKQKSTLDEHTSIKS